MVLTWNLIAVRGQLGLPSSEGSAGLDVQEGRPLTRLADRVAG